MPAIIRGRVSGTGALGILTHIQTIWSDEFGGFSQHLRLEIDGADLLLHDPAGRQISRVPLDAGLIDPNSIDIQALNTPGDLREVFFEDEFHTLDQGTLTRLDSAPASMSAYLDGIAFYGNRVTLASQEIDGTKFVHMSRESGSGIETLRVEPDGSLMPVHVLSDSEDVYVKNISSMATVSIGGKSYLISASLSENGLTVLEVNGSGDLRPVYAFGASEYLPVDTPISLRTAEMGGGNLLFVAAQSSSSLTVLTIEEDGALGFVDQVTDQRTTRFDGTSALDVTSFDGQTLAAVAGSDGGVTVWSVTPDGRLILRDTLVDSVAAGLSGISDLRFVEIDGSLELFAVSTSENGIARIRLDQSELGQAFFGGNGTPGTDVIFAVNAGGTLDGFGGNDILVDAAGLDWFRGGFGADHFVFAGDLEEDVILDFDPTVDRIDLSAYPLMQSVEDVSFDVLADGARLQFGSDSLRIFSAHGLPLDLAGLAEALVFDSAHVFMMDPPPIVGGPEPNLFVMSVAAENFDGGEGMDTVDYSRLFEGIVLDLAESTSNAGGAVGDVITNVENVIATEFQDDLSGDNADNRMEAGDGDDVIQARDGFDWILPGPGDDLIDGGGGRDMISYADVAAPVVIDLSARVVTGNGWSDGLVGIEGATGTSFLDAITGDAGDNVLRGLGGADWFTATGGADVYEGGGGRDMVSYVDAPSSVGVDLGAGTGLWGQAGGDTYSGVERVTGSSFGDTFFGGPADEDFRGLGGPDWFVGSPGADRFFGGAGNDMVSYAESSGSVIASLASGAGTAGYAAGDSFDGIERLTGSSFADVLEGDSGDNFLRGLGGRDRLKGGDGDDRLEGGGSSDRLIGGGGFDIAVYGLNRSDYDVRPEGGVVYVTALSGLEATDTLTGIEQLTFADEFMLL